jgi:hypothetical protein
MAEANPLAVVGLGLIAQLLTRAAPALAVVGLGLIAQLLTRAAPALAVVGLAPIVRAVREGSGWAVAGRRRDQVAVSAQRRIVIVVAAVQIPRHRPVRRG